MSVLKFFKLLKKPLVTPSTNTALLDPKGLLTKVLSSSAVTMVNDEVSKVSKNESFTHGIDLRRQIFKLTPVQRFEGGKTTAEHGVT